MPKKPPPNGYFYFMQDFRAREEKLGRRFRNGMQEVSELASDEWKALTQAEKDDYNKYAKEMKNTVGRQEATVNKAKKFNSQGKSFAQIERETKEKKEVQNNRKNYVINYMNSLGRADLKDHFFYLIHVNYFVKTDQEGYYPAEIALVEFTLAKGVERSFHTLMDPGALPMGYASDIKERADKYHRIPIEKVRGVHNYNLLQVYDDVTKFLGLRMRGRSMPPLFTLNDDTFDNTSLTAAKSTLRRLYELKNGDGDWDNYFKVFPLSHLFYEMRNKLASEEEEFPNDAVADTELRKDTYHFRREYCCQFHQEEDVIHYCSKSYVCRWTVLIRDQCCRYVGVKLEDGPEQTATEYAPSSTNYSTADDEDDDDDDDDDADDIYGDCDSVKSGATSYYTEKSVEFDGNSAKASFSSAKSYTDAARILQNKPTPSSAAATLPTEGKPASTAGKTWASVTVTPEASGGADVPKFDSRNFPSLGRGRKLAGLANNMGNLKMK